MGKISDYARVLAAKLADVFVVDQTDNGTTETKSATVEQIGTAIGTLQNFADLDTSNKTLVDSINEIAGYTPVYGNTASGAIATFDTSLTLPLQDLQIAINAVQESGTPTPSSPKAISGFTGANIKVAGSNLYDSSTVISGKFLNSSGVETVNASYAYSDYIAIKGGATYYYPSLITGVYAVFAYDSSKTLIDKYRQTNYLYTLPDNACYVRVNMLDTDKTTNFFNYPSTDTTYHPYTTPTTTAISWQSEASTVYGGSLDVTSGVLTVTHGFKTFTGGADENWALHGVIANCFYINNALDNPYLDNTKYDYAITNMFVQDTYNRITALTNGQFCLGDASGTQRLACKCTDVATAADWKTWLSTHNLTIAYKLATPVTYQLIPNSTISAIVGTDNIFTDTNGNTSVVYACSLKDYIDSQ